MKSVWLSCGLWGAEPGEKFDNGRLYRIGAFSVMEIFGVVSPPAGDCSPEARAFCGSLLSIFLILNRFHISRGLVDRLAFARVIERLAQLGREQPGFAVAQARPMELPKAEPKNRGNTLPQHAFTCRVPQVAQNIHR